MTTTVEEVEATPEQLDKIIAETLPYTTQLVRELDGASAAYALTVMSRFPHLGPDIVVTLTTIGCADSLLANICDAVASGVLAKDAAISMAQKAADRITRNFDSMLLLSERAVHMGEGGKQQ